MAGFVAGFVADIVTEGASSWGVSVSWVSSGAVSEAVELRRKRSKNEVFLASTGLFSDEGESMEVLILRLLKSSVSYHLPWKKWVKLND